eukprot:813077_1
MGGGELDVEEDANEDDWGEDEEPADDWDIDESFDSYDGQDQIRFTPPPARKPMDEPLVPDPNSTDDGNSRVLRPVRAKAQHRAWICEYCHAINNLLESMKRQYKCISCAGKYRPGQALIEAKDEDKPQIQKEQWKVWYCECSKLNEMSWKSCDLCNKPQPTEGVMSFWSDEQPIQTGYAPKIPHQPVYHGKTEHKPAPKVVPSITIPIANDESGEEGDDGDNDKTRESADDMFADAFFDDNQSSEKKGSMPHAQKEQQFVHKNNSLQSKAINYNKNNMNLASVADTHRSHTHDGAMHRTESEHLMTQPQPQPPTQAHPVHDDWNVGFENNDDIFGSIEDAKQAPTAKATTNGFDDTGFRNSFGDLENIDLNIVDSNPGADDGGGGGFGGNWDEPDINFDEQLFAQDNDTNDANVDDLFAADNFGGDIFDAKDDKTSTNDIFASFDFDANANTTIKAIDAANNANINTDLDNAGTGLFDDEFDNEQEITFPEFDVYNTNAETKTRKSKADKMQEQEPPQPSLQPNQITALSEPVISFDAPSDDNATKTKKESIDIDDDNPFGVDLDNDNDDDIDADNPFAMFDEPDVCFIQNISLILSHPIKNLKQNKNENDAVAEPDVDNP